MKGKKKRPRTEKQRRSIDFLGVSSAAVPASYTLSESRFSAPAPFLTMYSVPCFFPRGSEKVVPAMKSSKVSDSCAVKYNNLTTKSNRILAQGLQVIAKKKKKRVLFCFLKKWRPVVGFTPGGREGGREDLRLAYLDDWCSKESLPKQARVDGSAIPVLIIVDLFRLVAKYMTVPLIWTV